MKMRVEHVVPLSDQAIKLLEGIKSITFMPELLEGNDDTANENKKKKNYVFKSSISSLKPISENTLNTAIKRLDFGSKMVAHGFRSMFSTIANEEGKFNRDIIEKALAHKLGDKDEQAYNRAKYIEPRRNLMQWWADWLDEVRK